MQSGVLNAERQAIERNCKDSKSILDKLTVSSCDMEALIDSLKSDASTAEEKGAVRNQVTAGLKRFREAPLTEILLAREHLAATMKAAEVFCSNTINLDTLDFSDAFSSACASHFDKAVQKKSENQVMYDALRRAVDTAMAPPDTDIVMQARDNTKISLTCPILKSRMVDPVYNQACGHVYSRVGILSWIQKKPKCPIPGCGKSISPATLHEHLPTKVALEAAPSAAEESDGDDTDSS